MHRSRLAVILVDHADGHDEAVRFWSGALGAEPETSADEPEYTSLGEAGHLSFALQRLGPGTPSRVHLDFETDDVRAEVARLVELGATVDDDRGDYVILRDPGGLLLCVLPVQDAARFETDATTWE
jgi:catechol 2,3-dioxygenase-like lactoylglutathione lyase family enzyme